MKPRSLMLRRCMRGRGYPPRRTVPTTATAATDSERPSRRQAACVGRAHGARTRRPTGRLTPRPQVRDGCTPSAARAWAAASCSAAFFVEPLPTPSCSPSISAAQTNRRSCGGPSTVEHVVLDAASRPRECLLELRLRVDVAGARVLDPLVEGLDDRGRDDVEAVLEVDGRDRGLEQRSEDVPAQRDAVRARAPGRPARARRAPRRGRASGPPPRSSAARRRAP